MVEVGIMFSWLLSMLKIATFITLFAFSVLLLRVSKLKEVKFFALAAFSLFLSSLFSLIGTAGYLGAEFEIIEKNFSIELSKLFLFFAAIFFITFFYVVHRSIKKYV